VGDVMGRCDLLTLSLNRKGAKSAKGFFCWFILILQEGRRFKTHQALSGKKSHVHQRCSWCLDICEKDRSMLNQVFVLPLQIAFQKFLDLPYQERKIRL
jgi:hypothetical protein